MTVSPTIDALILAGGHGSRLGGRDKGLLPHARGSFAAQLAHVLRPFCRRLLISCNRHFDEYGVQCDLAVADEIGGFSGPLAGIHAAALATDADYLLICPCDTPSLDERFPARMLAGLQDSGEVRVADDGQRVQQLHLLLPTRLALSAGDYLEQGGRRVQDWLRPLAPRPIDFSDCPYLFHNINTPEDLLEWQSAHSDSVSSLRI